MAVNNLITFRKGTATEWNTANPVLASGEPGYDLTNSVLKIGDGISNWLALSGIGSTSVGGSSSSSVGVRGVISTTGTLTSFAVSGGYPVGYLDLFQDGVKLVSSLDFSATDGSNVTLSNSVPSGTVLEYLTMASGVSSGGGSFLTWSSVPASPTGTGTAGQLSYDGSYFYAAIATNAWKRVAWDLWEIPNTIAGLQLWLDASAADTLYDATTGGSLVAANGGVARWEDKSGNARHATQSTSANRPARKTAIQGGRDVLRFDGSGDALSIGDAGTFKFLHSANSTVFIALTRSSNSGSAIMCTNNGGTSTVGWSSYFFDGTSTNDRFGLLVGRGQQDVAVSQVTSGNGVISSGWSVLSFVSKPTDATAGNRASLRQNGGTAIADNAATGTASTSNSQGSFIIGAFVGFAADYGGDIAEIIIYDAALSDTDRAAVEQYLMQKWGIT